MVKPKRTTTRKAQPAKKAEPAGDNKRKARGRERNDATVAPVEANEEPIRKVRVGTRNGRNKVLTRAGNENGGGEKAASAVAMDVQEEEDTATEDSTSVKGGKKNARLRKRAAAVEQEEAGPSNARKTKKFEVLGRHDRGPGLVLTVGQGDTGQLGLGEDVLTRSRLSLVNLDGVVVDVCAGGMHTVCLTAEGHVYTFGCNDEGALGRDTSAEGSESRPGKVDIPGLVVQVSAGDSHTAALTDKGEVFVWGNFRDGSGGMGLAVAGKQETRPLHILDSVAVKKIASGSDHLALLTGDGRLFTCGCAEQGQLGRIAECFSYRGGRKGLEIVLTPLPVHVARSRRHGGFEDIWAGSHATFACAKETGDIFACGLNNYSQLGLEAFENQFTLQFIPSFSASKWLQIAAGLHHTLAIDDAGRVHSLGRKEYGRLGLGRETEDVNHPVKVPELGGVECVEVACGVAVSYCVSSDGTAFAWGMGTNGQLGMGDDEDRWEPHPIKGKQMEGRQIVAVGAGGQHAVMLARAVDGSTA